MCARATCALAHMTSKHIQNHAHTCTVDIHTHITTCAHKHVYTHAHAYRMYLVGYSFDIRTQGTVQCCYEHTEAQHPLLVAVPSDWWCFTEDHRGEVTRPLTLLSWSVTVDSFCHTQDPVFVVRIDRRKPFSDLKLAILEVRGNRFCFSV